jgi:hypothetical protein
MTLAELRWTVQANEDAQAVKLTAKRALLDFATWAENQHYHRHIDPHNYALICELVAQMAAGLECSHDELRRLRAALQAEINTRGGTTQKRQR